MILISLSVLVLETFNWILQFYFLLLMCQIICKSVMHSSVDVFLCIITYHMSFVIPPHPSWSRERIFSIKGLCTQTMDEFPGLELERCLANRCSIVLYCKHFLFSIQRLCTRTTDVFPGLELLCWLTNKCSIVLCLFTFYSESKICNNKSPNPNLSPNPNSNFLIISGVSTLHRFFCLIFSSLHLKSTLSSENIA